MLGRKNRSVSMPNHVPANRRTTKTLKKTASLPDGMLDYIHIKGVMRVSSLDESLHAKGLTRAPPSRNIEWDKVIIREYARALGDNPSCSSGPPVSIGWEYNPKEVKVKLEKYEDTRPPRRSMQEMVLTRDLRFKMLTQEWNVSRKECAEATRQSLKLKNQRRRTVHNLSKVSPDMEEKMESVGKKFKILSFKKSKSAEDLLAQSEQAAAALASVAAKDYEWEPEDDDESVGYPMDGGDEKKEEPEAPMKKKKPIVATEDDDDDGLAA